MLEQLAEIGRGKVLLDDDFDHLVQRGQERPAAGTDQRIVEVVRGAIDGLLEEFIGQVLDLGRMVHWGFLLWILLLDWIVLDSIFHILGWVSFYTPVSKVL